MCFAELVYVYVELLHQVRIAGIAPGVLEIDLFDLMENFGVPELWWQDPEETDHCCDATGDKETSMSTERS